MMRNMSLLTAAAFLVLAYALTPSAAMAQNYSGTWPLKAALPPGFGDTGCLTLVDNGIVGGVHSGTASISGDLGGDPPGTFLIVNNVIVMNFTFSFTSISYTVISAPAMRGNLGTGYFETLAVGYPYPAGNLTFGKKGGC